MHYSSADKAPGFLAVAVADAASAALDLRPEDVIVLPAPSVGAHGAGAVVTIHGRRRSDAQEAALQQAVVGRLATELDLADDLIAYLRGRP